MSNITRWSTRAALVAASVASLVAMGCGGGQPPSPNECLASPAVDPSAPITRIPVHFMAGAQPLLPGAELTAANGSTFKASMARFYASELALIGTDGARVPAELVDEGGRRLPYALTLLDFANPSSLTLYLQAPAGTYRGLALSVGVPEKCPSGEGLNHSDASAMDAPLDVDSGMYWSWNPGYVFLKFEGQVKDGSDWAGFFFHIGEAKRFSSLQLELEQRFTISPGGGAGPELIADFNQLLVSPDQTPHPDLSQDSERHVHGGDLADVLARNVQGSHFLRLEQGHL